MTLTPHRDAAVLSVEQAKERFAALQPREPIFLIGDTMSIDTCSAILVGAAEMMDRDVPAGRVGAFVNQALANALASYILTVTNGDEALSLQLLPLAMKALQQTTAVRLARAETDATIGRARGVRSRGTA